MKEYSEITTGGLSLTTILFLIFLVLKLCGVITWSWWWVTAPLWGGVALILGILLAVVIIGALVLLFKYLKSLF